MISLCAPTFDYYGSIDSYAGVAIGDRISRRGKRIATLDGDAVLVDGGYSVADRTFNLSMPDPDGSRHEAIHRMMLFHSKAVLSCAEGCFVVLLTNLVPEGDKTKVTAEVLEDIS